MKTAVITGASSGIGKLLVDQLLNMGWKVYGISRTQPATESKNFIWVQCDLSKTDSISDKLKTISTPVIDLLVSNAGTAFEEPASCASRESYEKMFSVNVLAPMLLVSCLKEKIQESTIISVSSVADRLVEKNFALYCSSKAANTRYFESLADELSIAKIYTLLPDYVDTPMLQRLQKGREFDWSSTIKAADISKLILDLYNENIKIASGSNIIVVTDGLIGDLKSTEHLYGFNTDTKKLTIL